MRERHCCDNHVVCVVLCRKRLGGNHLSAGEEAGDVKGGGQQGQWGRGISVRLCVQCFFIVKRHQASSTINEHTQNCKAK